MNALRTGSHPFDNFPRSVGGHSVNHHDFHTIRRVILRRHGAQAAGDVMSLISDGRMTLTSGASPTVTVVLLPVSIPFILSQFTPRTD